ncbi:hypothetical protein CL618_03690 [archaeon]|nr:hypothetical protein [archaeon]|tara:strand:- start:52 stop:294 length:243 start_codon:yes stop_codon:yes gene_type:complete
MVEDTNNIPEDIEERIEWCGSLGNDVVLINGRDCVVPNDCPHYDSDKYGCSLAFGRNCEFVGYNSLEQLGEQSSIKASEY